MITLSVRELAKIAIEGMGAMQKQKELEGLLWAVEGIEPVGLQKLRFLEIGVGNGGTTWALSKFTQVETFVSIDLPGGPFSAGAIPQERIKFISDNATCHYKYISCDSKMPEMPAFIAETFGGEVDFLFIDGDHTYEGVKSDYEMYSPLVRKGGLIAFHDIREHPPETGCEVKKFWDELKDRLPSTSIEEIIDAEGGAWAGIGLIRV